MKLMNEFQFKDIMNGFYDGPHATPDPSDEGPIFLGIKNIFEDGGIDFSEIRHISENEYQKWTKRVVPAKNDLVFSYEATLHRYALIPEGFRGCLGRRMALIRVNPAFVSEKYLYYYFLSSYWRAFIETVKISGATVDRISISEFPNYKISLPNLSTQRKIASILSAYDELIDNNNQRIRLLEEMAEEIYKEWFVRLRFPGYKTTKIVDGLPEGWKWIKVDEFFKTSSGGTPSREKEVDYFGGEIDWIKTGELKDSFVFDSSEKITEVGLKNSSAKMFPPNTLLMAMYGVNIGQLGISVTNAAANQAVCVFTPMKPDEYSLYYSFFFFKSIRTHLFNISMGAAQQNLSQDLIKKVNYFSPFCEVINKYDSIVKPFFEEIKILSQKNQLLQQTRDLLLPRLVSGKLSVEHLVEEDEAGLSLAAEPEVNYQAIK